MLTPQETEEIFGVLRTPRGRGPRHHLHQPQAVRGAGGRRPDHRHPARQGGRPAIPGETDEDDLAKLMVGREVAADRRPRREPSGAAGADVAGLPSVTIAGRGRPRRLLRRPGGRDLRHRRRGRQRAGRTGRGGGRAAQATGGTVTLAGKDITHASRARSQDGPRASSQATGTVSAWSCPSRSPTTWSSPATTTRHTRAGLRATMPRSRPTPRRRSRSTTSGRHRPM